MAEEVTELFKLGADAADVPQPSEINPELDRMFEAVPQFRTRGTNPG